MLHRLMVGQRILTPSILVRVQVKQPTKMPLKRGFFCWVIYHWTQTKSQSHRKPLVRSATWRSGEDH